MKTEHIVLLVVVAVGVWWFFVRKKTPQGTTVTSGDVSVTFGTPTVVPQTTPSTAQGFSTQAI